MKRRTLLSAAGASILAAPALAQGYPDKPIRMIVPYPPGGGTDGLGRITADRLSEKLGQQIVIHNIGGASSTIGSDTVRRADPDGYTLLFNASLFVLGKSVVASCPYDPVTDFTAIAQAGEAPLVPALIALTGNGLIGLTLVLLRRLNATEKPQTIVFYYMLALTAGTAMLAPLDWRTPATAQDFLVLAAIGMERALTLVPTRPWHGAALAAAGRIVDCLMLAWVGHVLAAWFRDTTGWRAPEPDDHPGPRRGRRRRGTLRLPSVVRAGLLRPRQPVLRRVGRDLPRRGRARRVAPRMGPRPLVAPRLRREVRRGGSRGPAPRPRAVRCRGLRGVRVSDWSPSEMMIAASARQLAAERVCFVGIGLPNIVCNLAKRTVAPDLDLIYESGIYGADPRRLPLSIGDPTLVTGSTAVTSMFELFGYYLQAGLVDVGFLGAAQIDRFGNINTTVIGDYGTPATRLPGSGGAVEIAINARKVFVIMRQGKRSFVERLDFRTSPGHSGDPAHDAARGWFGNGPSSVVTDLAWIYPVALFFTLVLAPYIGRLDVFPRVLVSTAVIGATSKYATEPLRRRWRRRRCPHEPAALPS